MSMGDLKDWSAMLSFVLGLPAAVFGALLLLRYWRARARKEGLDLAGIESEQAYLAALQTTWRI